MKKTFDHKILSTTLALGLLTGCGGGGGPAGDGPGGAQNAQEQMTLSTKNYTFIKDGSIIELPENEEGAMKTLIKATGTTTNSSAYQNALTKTQKTREALALSQPYGSETKRCPEGGSIRSEMSNVDEQKTDTQASITGELSLRSEWCQFEEGTVDLDLTADVKGFASGFDFESSYPTIERLVVLFELDGDFRFTSNEGIEDSIRFAQFGIGLDANRDQFEQIEYAYSDEAKMDAVYDVLICKGEIEIGGVAYNCADLFKTAFGAARNQDEILENYEYSSE